MFTFFIWFTVAVLGFNVGTLVWNLLHGRLGFAAFHAFLILVNVVTIYALEKSRTSARELAARRRL